MTKKITVLVLLLCLVISVGSLKAFSQDFPAKPMTFVVAYGTGGMTDTTARLIADEIKDELGQTVLVENREGGSGLVGVMAFLREPADGYTALVDTSSLCVRPLFLGQEEAIDPSELSYVGSYMAQQRVVFAQKDAPYKTWEEFIEYVKEHPGEVSFGGAGSEWASAIMKSIAVKEDLEMNFTMFDGGGDASAQILGGHVDVCETGEGTPAYQAAKEGDLRILINLSSGTVDEFPEVENVLDKGYPFAEKQLYGIVLKSQVPEDITEKWQDAFKNVMTEDSETIKKMEKLGLSPKYGNAKELEKIFKEVDAEVAELLEYIKVLEN